MVEPELENLTEIADRLKNGAGESLQKAVGLALQNITLGIVNVRHSLNALRGSVGRAGDQIQDLNKTITDSSASSERLARAIKNATIWGVMIAGAGVFVAVLALCWDIYKTLVLHQ
jgi:hypothetical protein